MALRRIVCRADAIPPGEMRSFEVEGFDVPVLIANVDGRLLATSGMCPHEDVELAGGTLEDCRLTCPGHGYEFDIATGACQHDPDLTLPTYAVKVEGEAVVVELLTLARRTGPV